MQIPLKAQSAISRQKLNSLIELYKNTGQPMRHRGSYMSAHVKRVEKKR